MKFSNRTKKILFFSSALIIIGAFILFLFLKKEDLVYNGEPPDDGNKEDLFPPATAIIYPEDKSWWNQTFQVEINDSDVGKGLVDFLPGEKGCRYLIEDLGTNMVRGGFRKCDPVKITIPVGLEKTCSSSFSKDDISQGKCKVSTLAIDKAGNDSNWKSKVFNIDLIKPQIQKIIVNQGLEINQEYSFETKVSDNSKITGCWLYINDQIIGSSVSISPVPCEKDNQCDVSLNYSFTRKGEFSIKFGCSDLAGNLGIGQPSIVKVATNHVPQISFCKVSVTQGNTETEFQFSVEASDLDGDDLSFLWDFGDGQVEESSHPSHYYQGSGNYEPKVKVFDEKGGEIFCSTAWITIE